MFEALALGVGTLVLVQPILSTSLLLSLFLGGVINGRHISRVGMDRRGRARDRGCRVPLHGRSHPRDPGRGEPLVADRRATDRRVRARRRRRGAASTSGSARAAFLGLAAGTLFGTSAVLTKAFVHYLGDGVLNWVPHWEPYALAVSSITGLVLAQSAFQTGALAGGGQRRAGSATAHRRRARSRPPRRAARAVGPDRNAHRRCRAHRDARRRA